jgi:hypothetical protein
MEQKANLRNILLGLRVGGWQSTTRLNFSGGNLMLARKYCDKNSPSCEVVFQREGHDVETVYWAGPMEEVRELARKIALKGGAQTYRVVEFTGGDSGVVPLTGVNVAPKRRQLDLELRRGRGP